MEYTSVYDALCGTALSPRQIQRLQNGWIRIPAIWRSQSPDRDVAVHGETGVAVDWGNGKNYSFTQLMTLLRVSDAKLSGNYKPPTRKSIEANSRERVKQAAELWGIGKLLNDPIWRPSAVAREYLRSRGIPDNVINYVGSMVRVARMQYNKKGARMLLPIISPVSELNIGLQRVFLNEDGSKRTTVVDVDGSEMKVDAKMMIGLHFHDDKSGGMLISGLDDAFARTVVVCEGFETALAILSGTGMSVYIAYDAGGMERVSLDYLLKLGFTNVIIASDNDDPDKFGVRRGQKAAAVLAARYYDTLNRRVHVATPPRTLGDEKSCDWLNVWSANAPKFRSIFMDCMVEYDPTMDRYREKTDELPSVRTRMLR